MPLLSSTLTLPNPSLEITKQFFNEISLVEFKDFGDLGADLK